MTHRDRINLYISEGRTVSGGKGDQTALGAEKSSSNFANTLQGAFSAQYGKQSAVNSFLTSKLTDMATNPTGFSAAGKAAMNTGAIQDTASTYQSALKAQQANSAVHGGNDLPSGVQAQIQGQLGGAAAGQLSGELNQNAVADAQLQNQNQWNALSGLQNVSNADDPLGFAGASTGATGNIADLSQAYTASNQSQLMSTLGGVVGGVGAAFATGGLSTLMGGGKPKS